MDLWRFNTKLVKEIPLPEVSPGLCGSLCAVSGTISGPAHMAPGGKMIGLLGFDWIHNSNCLMSSGEYQGMKLAKSDWSGPVAVQLVGTAASS